MTNTLKRRRAAGVFLRPYVVTALLIFWPLGGRLAAQTTESGSALSPDTSGLHDPGSARILLIARADADSVVLRWAPSTPHGWRVANRTGFVVERRTQSGQFVRLTPDTLHPWLAMRFIDEMQTHRSNPYLGLVLNALWADSVLIGLDGLDTLAANAGRNTALYGYALFAADNDPYIADAMGLRYVDRTVRAGDHYTYRVRMNEEREYRIDPSEVEVDARAATKNPPPVNLTARGMERRIELRWDPQPANEYTGYLVSRSDDGGRTFTRVNSRPIVIVTAPGDSLRPQGGYTDTSVINYRVYRYRVRGITPFGEQGDAAEVRAFARDLTPPPAPRARNPKQSAARTVGLEWEMPETSPDLAGFVISRSAEPDSNYHDLTRKPLPKTARRFTDNRPDEAEPYYIVASIDTAGNRAPSFPLLGATIDTLPPAVPTGFRGTMDSSGVVHLSWHRNRERNILGYRVLRANAAGHEFTQLTGRVCRDTSFTDTVDAHTLTRTVSYRVAAVNLRYNHSRASAVLVLRRPDTVPPESPVFSDVVTSDSAVVLRWIPSRSGDVEAHVLYRRLSPNDRWDLLAALSPAASSYVDRAVVQNTMYEYRIEAVDSSGLRSAAALTVQARPYESGVRAPVRDVAAVYNPGDRTIAVRWTYSPARTEKFYFVLYRSRDGAAISRYRSVDPSVRKFTDHEVAGPAVYEYAVKVMTQDGAESALSGRARVPVPKPEK